MVLHLDRTLTESLDARERNRVAKYFDKLKGQTHLSDLELKCVLLIFYKLTKPGERYLMRPETTYALRVIFDITDENMLSRLYSILERPNKPGMGPLEWTRLVNLYCYGSLEEKILFNWRLYDHTGVGHLGQDDVHYLTMNYMSPQATDEELNEFADQVLDFFDQDKDGLISFEDYKKTVLDSPDQLNILGRACPEPRVVAAFLATFSKGHKRAEK